MDRYIRAEGTRLLRICGFGSSSSSHIPSSAVHTRLRHWPAHLVVQSTPPTYIPLSDIARIFCKYHSLRDWACLNLRTAQRLRTCSFPLLALAGRTGALMEAEHFGIDKLAAGSYHAGSIPEVVSSNRIHGYRLTTYPSAI